MSNNPTGQKIKILIVDDSAFVRHALNQILISEPSFEIVGQAADGKEAIEKAEELQPDVITLDINMPVMNGLDALLEIKKICSAKVLMISSYTEEGAHATFEALSRGAVDFITKSLGDSAFSLLQIRERVVGRIKRITGLAPAWSDTTEKQIALPPQPKTPEQHREVSIQEIRRSRPGIVGIGISTGGPKALQEVIPNLPESFPVPIVIVIHMPSTFIGPFATRLNEQSKLNVLLAEQGQVLIPGQVLIAPGKKHLKLVRKGPETVVVRLDPEPSESLHCPSVDQTFLSIADTYPGAGLGVIMTGMGHDGLLGVRAMKKTKSYIFAQNQESCVVYGMPRAVVEENMADKVLSLSQIPIFLSQAVER